MRFFILSTVKNFEIFLKHNEYGANTDNITNSDEHNYTKRVLSILSAKKTKTLGVLLPKMSRYVKNFEDAKTMWFLVKDEKLLAKYN